MTCLIGLYRSDRVVSFGFSLQHKADGQKLVIVSSYQNPTVVGKCLGSPRQITCLVLLIFAVNTTSAANIH